MGFYKKEQLFGDLAGGLTAGIVALPLALAFGVQSGLGAIYGLYGAMILGMVAAIFGGTNTQVSGPTGPMTVVTAMVVSTAIELSGSAAEGMSIIISSFLFSGILLIALGLAGIGKTIRYMPYPVVSGFMSGVGIIIILFQLFPMMGLSSPTDTVSIIKTFFSQLNHINWHAFGLGLFTIAIIYLFPKLTKKVPSLLVALVVSTLTAVFLKLKVATIGEIPSGFPALKAGAVFDLSPKHYWMVLEFGSTLAALCAIDSLLTSVIADNITKTKHNSNKELVGQGIGNFISGLFAGLPGAGATLRTVVNINSGGRNKLSGFFHGLLLLFILLGLGKYVAVVPLPVLAGILITVGIGIIDYRGFRHLTKVPKEDAFVLIIVVLITVFSSLLHAVGVGLVLACVLFMKKSAALVEENTSIERLSLDSLHLSAELAKKMVVQEIKGPLFFGFSNRYIEIFRNLEPGIRCLIIDFTHVPTIDQSGLYATEEVLKSLEQKGILIFLCGLERQPMGALKRIDIVPALVPRENIFKTLDKCKSWIKENIKSDSDINEMIEKTKAIKEMIIAYRY